MQVFKAFFKVLKKKMPTAMIYVVVFLIISIMVAGSASEKKQFEATKLDVCIFDEDGTEASKALEEYIGKSHNIVELENNEDDILDALYYMRANYVLTIKKGYSDKLAAGQTDGLFTNYQVHNGYSTIFIDNLLDEYVRTVSAYTTSGQDISAAAANADEALSREVKVTIESFTDNTASGNEQTIGFPSGYFQYLPYIFISVMISALCPVLMTMNSKEIRYRTNCSCVKNTSQTLQILLGSGIFIGGIWLIFMIAGALFSGEMYSGKGGIAILNSFIFTIIAADIAILISSFELSENAVNVINQVIGLGMSFLCGVFVPLSLLGDGVISAARFLPAYWYTRINNMLAGIETYDGSKIAVFLGIETAFAVALALLSLLVRRLKYSGSPSLVKAK